MFNNSSRARSAQGERATGTCQSALYPPPLAQDSQRPHGTSFPAPVSEKKMLNVSSHPPMALSLGIWPSGTPEACQRPDHNLNGELRLDGGHDCVEILRHHITRTPHAFRCEVRISPLVVGFSPLRWSRRAAKHEVNAQARHQILLKPCGSPSRKVEYFGFEKPMIAEKRTRPWCNSR